MKRSFVVLIAENNSNVLCFLKRELVKENLRVLTVGDTRALVRVLNLGDKPDILIIDPHLPGLDLCSLLRDLSENYPEVSVIIHAYFSEFYDHPSNTGDVFFIEREGGSIENIKKVVARVIKTQETTTI